MRVLQTEKIGVVVNKRVYAFLKKKEKERNHTFCDNKSHEKMGLG